MAKKRKGEYGQGSIYKNADGSFTVAIRMRAGDKPLRKRAASRAGAEALRAELIRQRDDGLDVAQSFQRLEDFTDYWFKEVYLQRGTALRSQKHTLDMLELHILPALGSYALRDCDHARCQKLINDLRRRPEPLKPLSAQTVNHVASVLRQLFRKARAMNLIEHDPTLGLELPSIVRVPKAALLPAQIRSLLETVASHPHALAYELMAVLGLRIGEVLALRRTDFNEAFTEVWINQAINYRTNAIGSPKRESRRLLAVPPGLATRCAAQWRQVRLIQQDAPPNFRDGGLLIPSETGTAIQPNNFEKAWNGYTQRRQTKKGKKVYVHLGFRARAGLPDDITLHDLRAFCATQLADIDAPQRIIGLILGHGAKNVTEKYIRRNLATMRRALEKAEAALWATDQQQELEHVG